MGLWQVIPNNANVLRNNLVIMCALGRVCDDMSHLHAAPVGVIVCVIRDAIICCN